MMSKKKSIYVFLLVAAFVMLVISVFLQGEKLKPISGVLIGLGAGLVGLSVSNLLRIRLEQKNPKIAKQNEIEFQDERNTMIRYKSKAKAGDISQWLILCISFVTILARMKLWLTLSIIGIFLLQSVIELYYASKYSKQM